jgi:predicted nuclease of predicted toxin-antitoxin system
MTLWLDAQLSPRIARWISDHFDVTAIPLRDVGLRDAEDDAIWTAARDANVIVLTKDSDFQERIGRFGPPPQVIWLTCGNTSETRLKEILTMHFQTALDLLKAGNPLVEIQ